VDLNRLWKIGTGILIGATLLFGWLLGISPNLAGAKLADEDRVAVEAQNAAYEAQVATLRKQFEGIDDLKSNLASLQTAVPSSAEIPAFVAQLNAITQRHQVTLATLTVSDAQAYVPVAPVAPVVTDAAADDGSQPASTPAAPAEPTTAEVAAAAAPQPSELVTAENFVSVPISLSVTGSYQNVLDFVDSVQKGSRLAMVTSFTTSASTSTGTAPTTEDSDTSSSFGEATGTVSALIYVLLDPAAG
jgi:Tfp pilus assembly protein PilO